MILYAVKTDDGYLRDRGGEIDATTLTGASVFSQLSEALGLRARCGGNVVELTLTEREI